MKYLIDETDKRNKILKKIMKNNGFNAFTYENNFILEKTDKLIFAPNKKFDKDFCESLPSGITIFSGNISQEIAEVFAKKNIRHINFLSDEIFAIQNSHLTAEGILGLLIYEQEKSIFDTNILILGSGRVGKTLAELFGKIGVNFKMAANSLATYESCFYFSKNNYLGDDYKNHLGEFDVIINSVPSKILSQEDADKIKSNCLFLEIASISTLEGLEYEFKYVLCPALPQKFSAESAGKLLYECFLRLNKD